MVNKKRELPKSFRKMVIENGTLASPEAIETRWRIPKEMATFYHRQGPFFKVLRSYRDDIVHSGRDFRSIYATEKGFAVSADTEPFCSFGVWSNEHMLPNQLASLRPVVAHVVTKTLAACEDFAGAIQRIIQFPPEIAPGFKLFLRGFHTQQLLDLEAVMRECKWWE